MDSLLASSRDAWFSSSAPSAIQAYNDTRAPLAWGCENGLYGSTDVKVGIVDFHFDDLSDDLDPGSFTKLEPQITTQFSQASNAGAYHGPAVAALLAARGDNGRGIAGVSWRTQLRLYAMTQVGIYNTDPAPDFERYLDHARVQGVRVINLSMALGHGSDTSQVRDFENIFAAYLNSGPDRLIVVASGNDASQETIQDLASASGLPATDRALARLILQPAYAGKILFVTGTQTGTNNRWTLANVWTGTDAVIGAPSTGLPLLWSSGFALSDGTSFAAPQVAGAATLLWASDPTLSGAEVKDLLLRGARTSLPGTGGPKQPIVNGGGAYRLDIYGSLRLLSASRTNVPICGQSLRVEEDTATGGDVLVVPRDSLGVLERITSPSLDNYYLYRHQAAQGGRFVGVLGDGGPYDVRLANGTWNASGPRTDFHERFFSERDTVFIGFDEISGDPNVWVTGETNSLASRPLFDGVSLPTVSGGALTLWVLSDRGASPLSPDGRWIVAGGSGGNSDVGCQAAAAAYLIPLRAGDSPQEIKTVTWDPCWWANGEDRSDAAASAVWRHDGGLLWLAWNRSAGTDYYPVNSAAMPAVGAPISVNGVYTLQLVWNPGDPFVKAREFSYMDQNCRDNVRNADNPGSLMSSVLLDDCYGADIPTRSNAIVRQSTLLPNLHRGLWQPKSNRPGVHHSPRTRLSP